jgi:hypothetical protein
VGRARFEGARLDPAPNQLQNSRGRFQSRPGFIGSGKALRQSAGNGIGISSGNVELVNEFEIILQSFEILGNLNSQLRQLENLVQPRIGATFREQKSFERLLNNLLAQKARL